MIELERHIEILLLSNDCVIVPDLGGFMAHYVDARYDEDDKMFLPPLRTLGFNPQLKINDSLLVQSYIEAYDISYFEALHRIEDEVAELRQHLETAGYYELNDIGTLRLNDDGKLVFEPCEAGILTPPLYGLSTVELVRLTETGKTATTTETSETQTAEQVGIRSAKVRHLRNAVAVAAIIIMALLFNTPLRNGNTQLEQSTFLPIPTTVKTTQPQANTPASKQQVEQTVAENKPSFCLVLASQVTKHNSELFIEQLKKASFTEARILETQKMRRVVYGNYDSQETALTELKSLRAKSSHFREAWIMQIEN